MHSIVTVNFWLLTEGFLWGLASLFQWCVGGGYVIKNVSVQLELFFSSGRERIAAKFIVCWLCASHNSMNFKCISSFNPAAALWSMYIIQSFLQRRKQRHRKAKQLVFRPTVSKQQSQEGTWMGANELSHWAELLGWEEWWRRRRFPKLPAQTEAAAQQRRGGGGGLRKWSGGQGAGPWIQLNHFLGVWPWASYLTSLCLSSLICRMGIIIVSTSKGCSEHSICYNPWSSQNSAWHMGDSHVSAESIT